MRRLNASAERGAVLVFVAVTLVIILVGGAIAVDLSALGRQGQTLQNTADAAALAGVTEWTDSYDEAEVIQVVEDLVAQNGVELGDEISVEVEFPSLLEVEVALIDNDPEVFLAGVVGVVGDLERDASARLDLCNVDCNHSYPVLSPAGEIDAAGSGDGFVPLVVGNRLYSINHHGNTIDCVDRITESRCWPQGGRVLASPQRRTNNITHAVLSGDRIYYVSHSNWPVNPNPTTGNTAIGCFDTVTDTACPMGPAIANEGHGVLAGTADALYVFTSARKVHCFEPGSLDLCSGWTASGRDTAMTLLPSDEWQLADTHSFTASTIQLGSRIYATITSEEAGTGDFVGTWLHCWDTADDAPCDSFGTVQILPGSDGNERQLGRLFFFRDSAKTALAICSTGRNEVACYDLDNGAEIPSHSNEMWDTVSNIAEFEEIGHFVGTHTYHEASNRLFMLGFWTDSTTYCHDFNTGQYCGSTLNTTTALGPAGTYAYVAAGDCLIGYGHLQVFFTLKPDLSGECDVAEATVEIVPCTCGGEVVWPPVEAANLEGVGRFDARVQAENGVFLLPDDGSWIDLLTEELDLTLIEQSYPELYIELRVQGAEGFDPWSGDQDPTLLVGSTGSPHLVE